MNEIDGSRTGLVAFPSFRLPLPMENAAAARPVSWASVAQGAPESNSNQSKINQHHHHDPLFHRLSPLISSPVSPLTSIPLPFSPQTDVAVRPRMSEVGAADRAALLRSKRAQLRYVNCPFASAGKRVRRRIVSCRS